MPLEPIAFTEIFARAESARDTSAAGATRE